MDTPDIQYFARSRTWYKPPRAVRADIILQGAGGGGSMTAAVIASRGENVVHAGGGQDGEITVRSIPASQLPDEVPVTVGTGGEPGGRDGYACIITHLGD